jgi:hypothetical protein
MEKPRLVVAIWAVRLAEGPPDQRGQHGAGIFALRNADSNYNFNRYGNVLHVVYSADPVARLRYQTPKAGPKSMPTLHLYSATDASVRNNPLESAAVEIEVLAQD